MRVSTAVLVILSVVIVTAISVELGELYPFMLLGVVFLVLAGGVFLAENGHLLLARLGLRPERAGHSYVRALFGAYASHFDEHLLMELHYVAPNLLMQIIMQNHDGRFSRAIDVGCGTGLCGPLFAPFCTRLIGVDLSPDMLAEAEKKACYDDLIAADFNLYLNANPDAADLILAADVLVYSGTLSGPISAIATALKPGAMAAFTLEDLGETDTSTGWKLGRSGRYAHTTRYVRMVAERAGLEIADFQYAELRQQGGEPVAGQVWLLRKLLDDPAHPHIRSVDGNERIL
ncbi:MAG: methyltransferase [Pseudomonadota bacterium]